MKADDYILSFEELRDGAAGQYSPITIRDHIAISMLPSLYMLVIEAMKLGAPASIKENISKDAYKIADAMILESQKEKGE